MKINFLHELIDYLHGDKPYEVRKYIMEQTAKMKDNNKGYFWENVLAKKMNEHTSLLGGNTVGKDFSDGTDAKFATFYKRNDGVFEASVSNIRTKIGPLRVCLCVPGQNFHRVHFLFIPYDAYQAYTAGSDALKFTLNAKSSMVSGKLTKYICSFDDVCRPHKLAEFI
jgi:hypothetical protein